MKNKKEKKNRLHQFHIPLQVPLQTILSLTVRLLKLSEHFVCVCLYSNPIYYLAK